MPHDKNGKVIVAGDLVTVTFKVVNVTTGEEFCNCKLQSIDPMPPYVDQYIDLSAVNTHQVEKVG